MHTRDLFDWVHEMDKFCGREAEITSKAWSDSNETYWYNIDIDENGLLWCGNCFIPANDPLDDDDNLVSEEEFDNILRSPCG